jgi:cytochrome c oxidase subunit 2
MVVLSVLFSFLSPWWMTPLASNWGMIDDTLIITFVITGIAFAVLSLFMAYAIYRYRRREGARAHYEPENKKLEFWLTGVTTVGIIAMLSPGLLAWNDYIKVPSDAATVEVVGSQWSWAYRLPGENGVFGTVDLHLVSVENPFGLKPDDPNGQDDILIESNELHLPQGHPVRILLRSVDVLHNFFVPQFRARMDLVPGMTSYFWFTPERAGTYEILCAELCGVGHPIMRGTVVVEEATAYREWLGGQSTFAQLQSEAQKKRTVTQLSGAR